jgi:nitrate reductase NapD
MNISGVLVHARPEQRHVVKTYLESLPGVEVHTMTDSGNLVVTLESESINSIDTINSFHSIKGVLSASLIYHHYDE